MKFRQRISLDEYREANRIATRKKSFLLYVLMYQSWGVGLLILVGIFVTWFASHGTMKPWSSETSTLVLAGLLTLLAILPLQNRTETRTRYMKESQTSGDVEVVLTDTGFSSRASDGSSCFVPWSRFRSFLDCRSVFLLGLDGPCFLIISKQSLTVEEQAEMRVFASPTSSK